MASSSNISELVGYLEANDLENVEQAKSILLENVQSARDGGLVSCLVDKFMTSKSKHLKDILVLISADQSQYLFHRMNDHLYHGPNIQVNVLLAAVIKKQPSWAYKITEGPLLATLIKQLKMESDVYLVMSGSLILASLLPCIPSLVASHMGDMMDVLVRNASLLVKDPGLIPEVLLLHLKVSVYVLLQRLYSMYPNNFISYMKSCFGGPRRNDPVFAKVIKPMLELVKFHPALICDTSKSETENEKWKMYQPHDIMVECQKVSLDPLDMNTDTRYGVHNYGSELSQMHDSVLLNDGSLELPNFTAAPDLTLITSNHGNISASESINIATKSPNRGLFATQDLSSFCSPSEICGLTTPPQSRPISPISSCNDLNSIIESLPRPSTPASTADTYKDYDTNSDESRSSTPVDGKLIKLKKTPTKSESNSRRASDEFVSSRGHLIRSTELGDSLTKRALRSIKQSVSGHNKPHDTEVDTGRDRSPRAVKSKKLKKTRSKDNDSVLNNSQEGGGSNIKDVKEQHVSAPNSPVVFGEGAFKTYVSTPNLNSDTNTKHATSTNKSDKQSEQISMISKGFSPIGSREHSPPTIPVADEASNIGEQSQIPGVLDILNEFYQIYEKPITDGIEENQKENQRNFIPPTLKPKSPFELLDEFLDCGAQIYSAELTRIPMTSQLDTDWTYFGGSTPADELKILKSQVQLLHIQLLYERHKCNMHAVRNRRMAGKVYKAQAYTQQLNNIRDQVYLMEAELKEGKLSSKAKNAEIRQLADLLSYSDKQNQNYREYCQEKNKSLAYKIERLNEANSQLECKLSTSEQDNSVLRSKLFTAENHVANLLPKVSKAAATQRNVDRLNMEIVANETRQSQLVNAIDQMKARNTIPDSLALRLDTCENEIKTLRTEKDRLSSSFVSAKDRIQELDKEAVAREISLKAMKEQWDNSKLTHATELAAIHSKYKSLKKNCQNLHSYILRLYSKIENQAACNIGASTKTITKDSSQSDSRCSTPRWVSSENVASGSTSVIEMTLRTPEPDQESHDEQSQQED